MSGEAPAMNEAKKKMVLLKKLGGKQRLKEGVSIFFDRLVDHPELHEFFEGVDMAKLKWHQYNFFAAAFVPGMEGQLENTIPEKHFRLFDMGLCDKHFDIVISIFVRTLYDLGMKQSDVRDAVDQMMPMRIAFQRGAEAAKKRKAGV